jgi:RNA polymerase sigma-70 factor, ECF subfamily
MEDTIRKAGIGDDHAMRAVWRAHQPLLIRYLRARLGSDDAEDIAQQVWIEVARLVRRLPPDQADAVLLRIIADLDVGDVAAIMGKREGNVRVLVHRGLEKLGELLKKESQDFSAGPVTPGDQPSMNGLP